MIEIGNNIITAITISNTTPDKIDVGNTQVWPDVAPVTSITISPSSTAVTSAAVTSYITISVTASSNSWTVSTSDSWITNLSKVNNTTAQFRVSANSTIYQRSGTISFKIDGTTYATYTVTQAAGQATITLNPNTLSGLTYVASSGTITVTTNIPTWGVWITYMDPNTNWVTATKQNSTGISWSVTENTSNDLRIATITVSGAGESRTIYVRQTAGYVWNISSTGASVSSAAGYVQVTVNSSYQGVELPVTHQINMNTMGASIALLSSGSAGYHIYNITYPQRTDTSTGTFAVVFRQSGTNSTLTYTLYQSGAPASDYITISPTALTNLSSGGVTTGINVSASTNSWTATTTYAWITLEKTTNSQLMITVASATSTSDRTGYVYFKIDDVTYATLTVTQNGKYVPPAPSGVTVAAYYGDWVIGTITNATGTGPGGNYDVRGIVIVQEDPITSDYTATLTGGYYYGVPSSGFAWSNETISIPSGSKITVNSTTYNGVWVCTPQLNQGISIVTDFTVEPTT